MARIWCENGEQGGTRDSVSYRHSLVFTMLGLRATENLQIVDSKATTGFPVARASWTSSETRKSLSLPVAMVRIRALGCASSRKEEPKIDILLYGAIAACASLEPCYFQVERDMDVHQ